MLFAALAPSFAHAMSAARGAAWAEVCSVNGPKFVNTGVAQDTAADPVKQQTAHLEHCPFCSTHGGTAALLPLPGLPAAPLAASASHPFLFFQSPHPLSIWSTAQSRAPPALA
jgi:hypothetical protein